MKSKNYLRNGLWLYKKEKLSLNKILIKQVRIFFYHQNHENEMFQDSTNSIFHICLKFTK